jgi:hypothetical protein
VGRLKRGGEFWKNAARRFGDQQPLIRALHHSFPAVKASDSWHDIDTGRQAPLHQQPRDPLSLFR